MKGEYQRVPQPSDDSTHQGDIELSQTTENPIIERAVQDLARSEASRRSSTRVSVVDLHGDVLLRNQLAQERNWKNVWMFLFISLLALVLIYSTIGWSNREDQLLNDDYFSDDSNSYKSFSASTIAFGSCSSYDLRDLPIFTDAIIPTQPPVEAWIWAGDMVYLDESDLNCYIYENTPDWQLTCNCTPNWYQTTNGCHAADVEYAQRRYMKGLSNGKLRFCIFFFFLSLIFVLSLVFYAFC